MHRISRTDVGDTRVCDAWDTRWVRWVRGGLTGAAGGPEPLLGHVHMALREAVRQTLPRTPLSDKRVR
eukprot:326683-Rhodomonas_salina.1